MVSLKSRIEILFKEEQARDNVLTSTQSQRATIIRNLVRGVVEESSALPFLEDQTYITQEELDAGVPVSFHLLQVNVPFIIGATIQRYGDRGSNYLSLNVTVALNDRKPTYNIEHHVVTLSVESVSQVRLQPRLERIMKEIPSIVATILAE